MASDDPGRIAENVARVKGRIAAACDRSGRRADEVTLVAVGKYVDLQQTIQLAEAGCVDLGESRPQQLWDKADHWTGPPVKWHMIGHLQRNKARRTIPYCSLIHSVDSWRLLKSLQQVGDAEEMEVHALLEVNISGDASKHGLTAGELPEIIERLPALSRVHVGGLMAMGGRTAAEVEVRAQFAAVRQLRDELSANAPEGVSLAELSMGMSGDYEIAIEEGATLVRVGSVLFEESEPGL